MRISTPDNQMANNDHNKIWLSDGHCFMVLKKFRISFYKIISKDFAKDYTYKLYSLILTLHHSKVLKLLPKLEREHYIPAQIPDSQKEFQC